MYRYGDRKKTNVLKTFIFFESLFFKTDYAGNCFVPKKNPDVICPDFLVELILLNVFFELPASTYCNRILHTDLQLIQNNTEYRILFLQPDTEL